MFSVCVVLEDSPHDQDIQSNQYNSISPPASPAELDEPFSTYFEEKVAIPENANQVQRLLKHKPVP